MMGYATRDKRQTMDIKHIEMTASPGGHTKLTIIVDGDRTQIGEIVNKAQCDPDKYEVEIKRIKTKRGLTANAYYWVLCDRLAKALGASKDEVHEEMVQRYGVLKMNDKNKPAVFACVAGEDPKNIAKYSKPFAEKMINGQRVIYYGVIKGSSEMDAGEFGILLDGLISECEEVGGIEVMTPKERAQLEYLNPVSTNN